MKPYWWLVICLIVLVVTRIPYFGERFYNIDTAVRATQAWTWQQGLVPEADTFFSTKPPGLAWLYLQSFNLFGRKLIPLQVLALLLAALTATLLYLLGRTLATPLAGGLAAALYSGISVFGYEPGMWLEAHTEYPEMVCFTAAVLAGALFVIQLRFSWAFISGFFLACSVMMRQNALLLALFLLIAVCLCLWKEQRRRIPVAFLLALAGMVFGFAPWVVYYWSQDALSSLWMHSFVLPYNYQASLGLGVVIAAAPFYLSKYLSYHLIPTIYALWFILRRGGHTSISSSGRFTGLMLIAGVATASLGGRFSPHYFLQLAPFLALAAGLGGAVLYSHMRDKDPRLALFVPLTCIIYLAVGVFATGLPAARSFAKTGAIATEMSALGEPEPIRAIAQHIREHTRPEDRIAVIGLAPAIYWFAERLPATSDCWGNMLTGYFGRNSDKQIFSVFEDRYARELLERRPIVLVDVGFEDGQTWLRDYPLVLAVLKQYYIPATFDQRVTLWWRKDLGGGDDLKR